MAREAQQQPYDNLLKRLLEGQPTTIIPLLLGDSAIQVVEEVNVEVLIPPRRTDRVYKSVYKEKVKIFHFEFESAPDAKMDRRLLIYHALLLEKHSLPITSIIIYPFATPAVSSPLVETDTNGENILTFHYNILPLKSLDAREFIENQAVPVYGLIPAMQHTTEDLLLHAIEEMIQYYKNNDDRLRDELLCFKVLLERAKRLPEENLQRVLRRIHMFDPLLEEDPWIQELKAHEREEAWNKGIEQGRNEGKTEAYQNMLLNIIQMRFPSLANLAEIKAAQIKKADLLNHLINQIVLASDEMAARKALEASLAS